MNSFNLIGKLKIVKAHNIFNSNSKILTFKIINNKYFIKILNNYHNFLKKSCIQKIIIQDNLLANNFYLLIIFKTNNIIIKKNSCKVN